MSDPLPLAAEIAKARAHLAHLERLAKSADCSALGHNWTFNGCRTASCSRDCCCSVPVHECARCGDCDYGDNDDADDVLLNCEADHE